MWEGDPAGSNPMGADLDIGNSPILKSLPEEKRTLIVGTKQGHLIALDPDNKGAVLYRVLATTGQSVTMGGGRGGNMVWGGAADDQNVYYGAGAGTGLVALRLGTGVMPGPSRRLRGISLSGAYCHSRRCL